MTSHDSPASDAPRRVTVTRIRQGWEVREERDNQVVRRAHLTDWHRVERAMERLGLHDTTDVKTDVSRPPDADLG